MPRKPKIPKCSVCKNDLRNIQTNQWMCQQSSNNCEQSLKVLFYSIKEEEE